MKTITIDGKKVNVSSDVINNSTTYEKVHCGSCQEANFVYIGDVTDLSKRDIDAFSCWNCGEVYLLHDDEFLIEELIEQDWLDIEEGKECVIL